MNAAAFPDVPIAQAGPVTDFQLEQVIHSGHLLQQNLQPSEADLALLLLTGPQIAAELLYRRRAMGVIEDMVQVDNVTFLPSPPGTSVTLPRPPKPRR